MKLLLTIVICDIWKKQVWSHLNNLPSSRIAEALWATKIFYIGEIIYLNVKIFVVALLIALMIALKIAPFQG